MKTQFLIIALFCAVTLSAQVSVSTDGSSPDPSSMLDVKSANKGMLIPRVALTAVNAASPIASPAVGLLVYNTATAGTLPNNVVPGFYSWNVTRWVSVTLPQGTTTGDMLYWDGTQWVLVPSGDPMQILKLCNGVPTWGACMPALTTTAVFGITQNAATSGGNITNDGGSEVTARGVCWNTAGNPTLADVFTEDGSGIGVFGSDITGLTGGNTYHVRAYATNSAGTGYGNELSFNAGGIDSQPCPGIPTVSYGGQTYNTVKIGTQCWFKENLNIGTMITGSQAQADNQVIEKYCYGNDPFNCTFWGGMYQWNEMMNYSVQQGAQGICPSGWHIPSDAEYCTLATYLDGTVNCQTQGSTGTSVGGKMKETGTAHWDAPNYGATNSSGFSGIGGGYAESGNFGLVRSVGHYWSSSTSGSTHPFWMLYNGTSFIGRWAHLPGFAFSVRCVKDIGPGVTTSAISDTSANSAACGGTVTSNDGGAVTARGVCWNTTGGPTIEDSFTSDGTGTGAFTSQLTNLEASTTYFVRAYATTGGGTSYGNQVVFASLEVVVPSTAWELAGNNGTDPGTNFIGTIDNIPLNFRVNNEHSGLIDPDSWNTALGYQSLHVNDAGLYNSSFGHWSLFNNSTGSYNTANGAISLINNTEGSWNTAVGALSMNLNLSGASNTAVGAGSLMTNSIGNENTALGIRSMYNLTEGGNNTAIGTDALFSNTNGYMNVALGYGAGYYETGSNKLFIDNQTRTNESDGREKALVYGVFDVDPANQKLTLNANVGINTTMPDSSAALDVSSTTKGFLPPRMTVTQRDLITNPAEGLIIYNISSGKFEYYNGSDWKAVISTTSSSGSSAEGSGFCSEGVTDYDGHHYKSVKIGDQCWMAENLKSTHYSTGAAISGVYAYFNQECYALTYGRLYTWAALMNGAASSNSDPSGVQGVCPEGWHVPSDAEWKELEMTLGMSQSQADATGERSTHGEGIKLKETDDAFLWETGSQPGNNASGFSGLPGGIRYYYGGFDSVGGAGGWWTSTENVGDYVWIRELDFCYKEVNRCDRGKDYGFSVRCLKD